MGWNEFNNKYAISTANSVDVIRFIGSDIICLMATLRRSVRNVGNVGKGAPGYFMRVIDGKFPRKISRSEWTRSRYKVARW